ncbi:RNA-binding protein 12, partial [Stegodyphus mimosarum]
MSIIIRLQNLPLSATSGDIRHFFGGLRIPEGGVHILGGEKGDAFIAFYTDEDARIAMKRDGSKIKDARIRLYLSSRMEMQHEIERVTKGNFSELPEKHLTDELQRSGSLSPVSFERKKYTSGTHRSRSPYKFRDANRERSEQSRHYNLDSPLRSWSSSAGRAHSPQFRMSRSPRRRISRSPLRSKSPSRRFYSPVVRKSRSPHKRKSHSPVLRSRSPRLREPRSRRSQSPATRYRDFSDHGKQVISVSESYTRSVYSSELKKDGYSQENIHDSVYNDHFDSKIQLGHEIETNDWKSHELHQMDAMKFSDQDYQNGNKFQLAERSQAELERRITDVLKQNYIQEAFGRKVNDSYNRDLTRDNSFETGHAFNQDKVSDRYVHFTSTSTLNWNADKSIIAASQHNALPTSAPNVLPSNMLSSLPPNVLPTLQSNVVPSLPPNAMSCPPPNAVSSLPPGVIPSMPPNMLSSMPPNVGSSMPPAMIPSQPRNVIPSLPPSILPSQPPAVVSMPPNAVPSIPPALPPPVLPNSRPPVPPNVPPSFPTTLPPAFPNALPPPPMFPGLVKDINNGQQVKSKHHQSQNFYITISGLDPNWSYGEIQTILNGIYVPQNDIKWEIDQAGLRTGTSFIKLLQREDFVKITSKATFNFNNRRITVSECPEFVFQTCFPPDTSIMPNLTSAPSDSSVMPNRKGSVPVNSDLCCVMKGLPFNVTYRAIRKFFRGLSIADIFVIYAKNGRATGTGYVSFTNFKDFVVAKSRNGRKISHRYIEVLPCSDKDMIEAKNKYGNSGNSTSNSTTSSINNPLQDAENPSGSFNKPLQDIKTHLQTRPLCALLTGLPPSITSSKISAFFKKYGLKPDAIHITLNDKNQPNGRAYVEFSNFLDFEAALKCHGNFIENNLICVKQILYDEMTKILNTQKAKHNFQGLELCLTPPDLPAKVPYLWEPPDDDENQGKISEIPNTDTWATDTVMRDTYSNHGNMQSFEFNRPRELSNTSLNMSQNIYEKMDVFEDNQKYNSSDDAYVTDRINENRQYQSELQEQQMYKTLPVDIPSVHTTYEVPPVIQNNTQEPSMYFEENSYDMNMAKEDSYRAPVKFEVRTKQSVSKNSKMDDAFSQSFHEEKRKLIKLSPDRHYEDIDKIDYSHKEEKRDAPRKLYDSKEKVTKSENSERAKDSKRYDEKFSSKEDKDDSISRLRRNSRDRKATRSRRRSPSPPSRRSRNSEKDRRRSPVKSSSHHLNERSDFRRSSPHKRISSTERQCVVQICNVHPSVDSDELEYFFRGFRVNRENFIRRFAENGEPTGDVRVTFENLREAEKAIRDLNRRYLKGIPIEMFVVG